MVEDLISALAKAFSDGTVNATPLLLFAVGLILGRVVWILYVAKERQARRDAETMNHAATAITTLTEQLRTMSERQRELQQTVATAGQNAARNHETLTKIETMLDAALRRL